MPSMEERDVRGEEAEVVQEASGWVSTAVAARALRVTPRSIRTYIDQGRLEARAQGEGVRKSWLVSVESLEALRDARDASERGRGSVRPPEKAAEDLFLEVTSRLEIRSAEVGELRVRLQIAERTQNMLEEERRQLADDLKRERETAERLERDYKEVQGEVEQLAAELEKSRQETQQLRAELEQGRGFFRRRRPAG
jgi:chromosome segregation ATPase